MRNGKITKGMEREERWSERRRKGKGKRQRRQKRSRIRDKVR